jgi:hypothetical protein
VIERVVYFNDRQRALIEQIARARCDAKAPHIREQDSDFHTATSDRAYPHIVGLAAEAAYAMLTGQRVDGRLYRCGDETDFSGVEVKATTHSRPPFVLAVRQTEYERKTPLAYVLARVDSEATCVRFEGSVSRARFDALKAVQRGKHLLNWAVGAHHLAPGLAVVEGGVLKLKKFDDRKENVA